MRWLWFFLGLGLASEAGLAQSTSNSSTEPVGITFPPPRFSLSIGGGLFAIAGRPYAFRSSYYHSTKFKPGPMVRVDATIHAIGPFSVKAGVAHATPQWELNGFGCECSNQGPQGLHVVQLSFYDVGTRISLARSDAWPPDQFYLDLTWGLVHQRIHTTNVIPSPGASSTNGALGIALGGTYAIRERVGLTLHVEDKVTHYAPADITPTRRTQSNNILTTVGVALQMF